MSTLTLLIVFGILAAVTGWFLSGWSIHKANKNETTSFNTLQLTSDKVWYSLTPAQQKDLLAQKTFVEQEEWVEDNVDVSLRSKLTPERIILAMANQSFISLGSGSPKRLANIADLVKLPKNVLPLSFKQKKAKVKARLHAEELSKLKSQRRSRYPSPRINIRKR